MAILFRKRLERINKRLEKQHKAAHRTNARSSKDTRSRSVQPARRQRRAIQLNSKPETLRNVRTMQSDGRPSSQSAKPSTTEILDAICDVLDIVGTSQLPAPIRQLHGELLRYLTHPSRRGRSHRQLISDLERITNDVRNEPADPSRTDRRSGHGLV